MPTISAFCGILIQMLWSDHAPPHFHALDGEYEAVVDIRTLEVVKGDLHAERWPSCSNGRKSIGLNLWRIGTYAAATSRRRRVSRCHSASPRPSMPWRVASVEALPGYRLRVRFLDGLDGVVDMSALIASPNAGVFALLADSEAFNRASVAFGAVCWPCGLDIAPDAIYAEIKASNRRECALS